MGPYMREERGWLQIALDIHMTTTGSMERPDEQQAEDIKNLTDHLYNWERTYIKASIQFDEACYAVMMAALIEADAAKRK